VLDAPGGVCKALRLSTPLRTSNMFLFDQSRRLRRGRAPTDIVRHFFDWRRPLYAARHRLLDEQLSAQIHLLEQQAAFIAHIVAGRLVLHGRTRAQLDADLEAVGLKRVARGGGGGGRDRAADATPSAPSADADAAAAAADVADADAAVGDGGVGGSGRRAALSYDYLLHMPFLSLSHEKCEQLRAEVRVRAARLAELRAKTPLDLWRADLAEFRVAYAEFCSARAARNASYVLASPSGAAPGKIKTKRSGAAAKRTPR
jgi:hypothetical protein